ncbi:MAG: geranylgeranylglyceryl/heptaprenylglyceryl phosphate synthase [Rhodothermales bacterium]
MPAITYDHLLNIRHQKGAGFIVLVDPDKLPEAHLPAFIAQCAEADVDAFFVGGSLLHATAFERYVQQMKGASPLPVIGFPGSLGQLTAALDAVLFLSVISGRNPEHLFGQHVQAAPLIRRLGLEPISTGYMLIESGRPTTAQYMSHTLPIPRHKPEIAAATALAAEMMGMRLLYTDGGSGADETVPEAVVEAVTSVCRTPLLVGGGLRTPSDVERKVQAGAAFVVVGNAIEEKPDAGFIAEMAAAAHLAVPRPI